MTKKECILYMIILWNWLADHPEKNKSGHPFLNAMAWVGACPLCQLLKEGADCANPSCDGCLMAYRWPTEKGPGFDCGTGAFAMWAYRLGMKDPYDRSFFALLIAEEAELLYKEL